MQIVEKTVSKDITIQSPIDLVWYAWTISERVTEWFAPEAHVEPVEEGAYELYFVPGNTEMMNMRGCKIVQLKREEYLRFTWKGPDQFADLMNGEGNLTVVDVTFTRLEEDTTKVSIRHAGFLKGDQWNEAVDWHDMAWSGVLNSLKSALEKGEGTLCCQPD